MRRSIGAQLRYVVGQLQAKSVELFHNCHGFFAQKTDAIVKIQ
tara:strand:- start:1551 stop:1679 length:129 start_codon:yes stop_codon:yes gene_type:complete